MRAVLTRVKHASVSVDGKIIGQIGEGFLVLLGVTHEDTEAQAEKLADKLTGLRIFEDENEKMNNPTQDDDTTVETTKPTADDGEAPSAPAAAPALDPAGLEAALKAYIAATNGATADDENDPAAGDTTDKPTKDEGEGDDPAKPDVLADITARRDAMEDGPAKADINTLLSMLDAANARARFQAGSAQAISPSFFSSASR